MIPRTVYEEEHELFRTSVRKLLEEEAAPHHEQWEKNGQVDPAIWLKAGELGMICPTAPEEFGGVGVDFRYNAIVGEEVARLGLTGLGFNLQSDVAVPYIIHYGTDEQKRKYLPKLISGELIIAIAMTEPGTGSDLQGVKTTAIKDGDDYIINGSKTFITNGQLADLVIVVVKTEPELGANGTSLVLIETGTEGFSKGQNLKKAGMKAQDTSELFFENARIPQSNLLGKENKGFIYLMQDLPQERLSISITAIASAESILEQTIEYTKERIAFGKPISALQNTQFKLAEMASEITVLRVFIDKCLELHIQGKLDTVTASKAKYLSTDLQC